MRNLFFNEEEYKKELLPKIRKHINKFNDELTDTGTVNFIAHNLNYLTPQQEKTSKIVKKIIIGWLLFLYIIASIVVYKELIIYHNINISLIEYILIVSSFIVLFLPLIYISIKKLKRIDSIVIDDKTLTITLLNTISMKSEVDKLTIIKYNLNEIDFDMKRRRSVDKDNEMKNDTFNIYITHNGKKETYLLDVKNKEDEFFAFSLFLESIFNKLDINSLLDDELYRMYHIRKYGLNLKKYV